jgi:hypothetical protein
LRRFVKQFTSKRNKIGQKYLNLTDKDLMEELQEQKPLTIGKKKKSENMDLSDAKVIYEFI